MATRREFLEIVTAAAGLAFLGKAGASPTRIIEPACGALERAVVDERFAEGVTFGRAMAARGVAVSRIDGDITRLWYDDLDPRLRQRVFAFGGLTTQRSLLYFEQLARGHGLRVLSRLELEDAPDPAAAAEPKRLLVSWIMGSDRIKT